MNLKVEYLGEIEVIFEMALGNESGNQVGSIHEKNQSSKISWDYLFKGTGSRCVFVYPACDEVTVMNYADMPGYRRDPAAQVVLYVASFGFELKYQFSLTLQKSPL
jgi:hypothetical protein